MLLTPSAGLTHMPDAFLGSIIQTLFFFHSAQGRESFKCQVNEYMEGSNLFSR